MEHDPGQEIALPLPYMAQADLEALLHGQDLWEPSIDRALQHVQYSHGNQARDDGTPYPNQHLFPMAADMIRAYAEDGQGPIPASVLVATLLHDAPEDDPRFTLELCAQIFEQEVAIDVGLLTKTPERNDPNMAEAQKWAINEAMLDAIKDSGRLPAQYIKLADRTNNLESCPSIRATNPQKFQRYLQETAALYVPFAEQVSPYFYRRLATTLDILQRATIL